MSILSILLEITVYSALIFCFIMLFKKMFGKHISPSLHYLIWLLLVVRLIMPVTIDSGFSLFTIPVESVPVSENVQASTSNTVSTDIYAPDENISQTSNSTVADFSRQPNNLHLPSVSTEPAAAKPFNWSTLLLYVWIVGAALSILYLAWSYLYLKSRIRKSAASPNAALSEIFHQCVQELGIKRNIRMVLQDEISSPALLVFPVMLIPADIMRTMDKQQIAFAIKHELMHYKRKDHIACLLLSLLQTVYWFNPFVWLAYRQIRMDMETACDSMVVKTMDGDERLKYAATVLSLFSRKKQLPVMLGMAVANTKKTAKKRLKGIYMKQKSNRKGRLATALLACAILITCFTTACQPTPEKPIVVNKADGLSDLIQSTPGGSSGVSPSSTLAPDNDALYEKLAVPKHWNFETTALGGNINITADVDIELPGVSKLPAATATLSEFTQEDLEKIADVLGIRGSEWTEVVNEPSKEKIAQWIIEDKEEIANSDDSFRVEKVKDNLKAHEQMYIDAPYESELIKILTEFEMSEVEYIEGITGVRFEGTTMINEQPYYFFAGNYFGDNVRSVRANLGSRSAGFYGTYSDEPYEVSLTKEQAAEQSGEIAKQLTDELTLCYVVPTVGQNQEHTAFTWGWACVFMREINGCPTAYESTDVGSSMESEIREPIRYEKMVIVMGDTGMLSFIWENPMTIESIDNPDVTLLSFDEISQRAAAQIGQHWAYSARDGKDNEGNDTSDPGCTAIITKVELGLMRVAKADSDDYYYIPVWNFFTELEHSDGYWERMGEEPSFRDDLALVDEDGTPATIPDSYPQAWGAVTINALDGSVIDRNLGY